MDSNIRVYIKQEGSSICVSARTDTVNMPDVWYKYGFEFSGSYSCLSWVNSVLPLVVFDESPSIAVTVTGVSMPKEVLIASREILKDRRRDLRRKFELEPVESEIAVYSETHVIEHHVALENFAFLFTPILNLRV